MKIESRQDLFYFYCFWFKYQDNANRINFSNLFEEDSGKVLGILNNYKSEPTNAIGEISIKATNILERMNTTFFDPNRIGLFLGSKCVPNYRNDYVRSENINLLNNMVKKKLENGDSNEIDRICILNTAFIRGKLNSLKNKNMPLLDDMIKRFVDISSTEPDLEERKISDNLLLYILREKINEIINLKNDNEGDIDEFIVDHSRPELQSISDNERSYPVVIHRVNFTCSILIISATPQGINPFTSSYVQFSNELSNFCSFIGG